MTTGQVFTNTGRKVALNRLFKSSPDYTIPTYFAIGQGTTAPANTDTALGSLVPVTGTEAVDSCDATTSWTDSADMTVSLNNSIYIEGTGALNLTKDGTGSATASTSKTTTSRDFTSKNLSILIYIADSTVYAQLATSNCLTIRFGSDSSNYYQWTKNKANLTTGWNFIGNLTSANAGSTTGSPSISACDYTYVGITATASGQTWASGKIIMDDIKVASSDDYYKAFVSGYPVLDETNLQATIRGILLTTEGNGATLTEWGVFNADATKKLISRQVFTAVSKTGDVQLIFVSKDRVT